MVFLDNIWYSLAFSIQEFTAFFVIHFAKRGPIEWIFFFFPFYVFGEFPRYVLPAVHLLAIKMFSRAPKDDDAKANFIATGPSVSVLVVGLNEEKSIVHCIESLLELNYPNLEIIVVDDHSTDRMHEKAKPYADRGLIKLFKNTGAAGRFGRPVGSNMALSISKGEFILSVDADTSFDRDVILHMIGPFYDQTVGVVAGNLKVRNIDGGIWPRLQAIEYAQSISLWKNWLNTWNANVQASGAFGAFRRKALQECGGWDSELAEDADLSLKIKRSGWKIIFAPKAIAMTTVPSTLRTLVRQRHRWDRSFLRTYFHKHGSLMRFWRYDWRNAVEMSLLYFFDVFLTFLYVIWFGIMISYYPLVLVFIFMITYFIYLATGIFITFVSLTVSERGRNEWGLLLSILPFPTYKGMLRLIRLYSLTLEALRLNYSDEYLPESAWRNTRKW